MKELYYYSLAGAWLSVFVALIVCAQFRTYFWAAIFAAIGVVCGMCGVFISLYGSLVEAQGMQWNFLGVSLFNALGFAYFFYRWRWLRKPLEEKILDVRKTLTNDCDVALPLAGYRSPGTCWECGKDNAPIRQFRLSRVIVLPIAVGGESVFPLIPLCDDHSDWMHFWPRWAQILSGPLAALIFLTPLIFFGDSYDRYSRIARQSIMLSATIAATVFYILTLLWVHRKQRFRLRSLDAPNSIMVVRFSNPNIVNKVRLETALISNQSVRTAD